MALKVEISHPHSIPFKRFLSSYSSPFFAWIQVSFMQINLKLENLEIRKKISTRFLSFIMLTVTKHQFLPRSYLLYSRMRLSLPLIEPRGPILH